MNVQVYAGGVLAYDNRLPVEKGYAIQSILIDESLNKGGTATLILPPQHPMRNSFPAFRIPVEIYRDGKLRWRGRALPHADNFYRCRTIICEGELCFLNDATLRPYIYTGSPADIFISYIGRYNATVERWKRFAIGSITVPSVSSITVSFETAVKVYEAVSSLLQTYGGYIIFDSSPAGVRRINWHAELPYICNQPVQYGYNLMDYSSQSDISSFATRLIPYGALNEDGSRVTIGEYGNDYVENAKAVAERGVIEAAVYYDDITDPAELQTAAEQDLAILGTLPELISLSAYDLSRQDLTLDSFQLGQRVNAESVPHEMTGLYDLISIREDLCNPNVGEVTLTRKAAYIDSIGGTPLISVASIRRIIRSFRGRLN